MANQSLISVPPNVDDPIVLRRFLSSVVEQLDIIQGNRAGADNRYVETQQLLDAAALLRQQVEEVTSELEAASLELSRTIALSNDLIDDRFLAIEQKNADQDFALGNYVAIKAVQLVFTVDGSNNIIHNVEYNIDTAQSSRVGVGLYEFEVDQTSFGGEDLLSNITVSMQEELADSLASEAYHLSFDNDGLPTGAFRIKVQAIVLGVGNKIEYQDYDIAPGDQISLTALFNIPSSVLPPSAGL